MPKVSVITPTYNCAKYLSEALDSALGQSYKDIEIIVVDDGSKDDTGDIVKGYADRYPGKVRYFYQDNKGQAVARNLGISESKGEYVALLDADDVWLSNRLEEGVNALDQNPDIGLVHSNVTKMTETGDLFETPKRDKRYLSGYIFKYLLTQEAHISCLTVIFRKKCCEIVGMFDESLSRLGSEDRDLWLRISQKYKVLYLDKVLAYYRMREEGTSRSRKKMFEGMRYVIDKFCPDSSINRTLRKKSLSKVHRDLGDEYLYEREFDEAARHYIKALSLVPFSFWPWVNLIKASFRVKVK